MSFGFAYKKIWNIDFAFVTFLPQSSTTHSLKGFVLGGFSLPLLLRLTDLFDVHSPQYTYEN
jgi:hypothetical protein